MTVVATYTDGSQRDVTAEAFLVSSNIEVATVDKAGVVKAVRRGSTAMLARYEGNYAAAPMIIMGDRSGFAWKPVPEFNYIDGLVYGKLKELKILPSDVCDDSDFIRRLYIDITGLPPEPDAVRAFLKDARPSKLKRDELINKLVGSPDFVEHWANKWADLLQVNRKFLGVKGAEAFRDWIKDAIAKNMPYDQFCYQLLTGSGSNMANPAASYFKILRDPDQAMENTTHLFLAIRFNCNKCHDHPFERWTQNQYYTTAAYFARISRTEDPKYQRPKDGRHRGAGRAASGGDHQGQGRRRGQERPDGPMSRPRRSRSRTPTCPTPRRPAASNWPSGSRPRTILISPRAMSIASGAICWAWASSSQSTISAPAIPRPTRPCSIGSPRSSSRATSTCKSWSRRSANRALISMPSPPTNGTPTTMSITRMPSPAGCRRKCSST